MDMTEDMAIAFPEGYGPLVALSKAEINALPLYAYEGPITLVTTPQEEAEALHKLHDIPVIGFDTETKPSFKKGTFYNPSLIQIATHEEVFLFHLKALPLSRELIAIFETPKVIKAGVAISDDMRTLGKLSPFSPKGLRDLSLAAKHHNIAHQGLRSLAALLLGVRISKNEQCSNWGRQSLTDKQIRYAATDAWISLALYLRMNELSLSIHDAPIQKSKPGKRATAKKPSRSNKKDSPHKESPKQRATFAHFPKNDTLF